MSPLSASDSSPHTSTLAKDGPLVAEVALLRRTLRGADFFDYAIKQDTRINPGDLVRAPFRSSFVPGIVLRLKPSSHIKKLKEISAVWVAGYVTAVQLELAGRLSRHNGVSLGASLMLFAPVLPLRKTIGPPLGAWRVIRPKRARAAVVCCDSSKQNLNLIRSLLSRVKPVKQALVLVASQGEAEHLAQYIPGARSYTAELAAPLMRRFREDVALGKIRIVVGTRAAIFLPFFNLGGIIVNQSEHDSYKQYDQNPRYDAREVANWLAELSSAALAFISLAPPLGSWHSAQQGRSEWRHMRTPLAQAKIIDRTQDGDGRGRSIIGYTLEQSMAQVLNKGGRVLLYLNRLGNATSSLCRDCGFTAACDKCSRPMAYDAKNNRLACYHCAATRPVPLPCPKCGGTNVVYFGVGLDELNQAVTKLWPRLAVAKVNAEADKKNLLTDKAAIVIGTKSLFGNIDLGEFSLAAMVAPDAELALPEYRAAESLWQTARALQCGVGGQLVVQTRRPDHYVWQSLAANKPEVFYKNELAARTQFKYPPITNLIRLTAQSADEREAWSLARDTREALQGAAGESVALLGPYPDYYRQVRGRYRFHILLRYPREGYDPARLWPLLPDAIIIDRHPITVLG